jgi:hypothetical protein
LSSPPANRFCRAEHCPARGPDSIQPLLVQPLRPRFLCG